jgi:LmbE family N-acetylglucosaminyl deacetylase
MTHISRRQVLASSVAALAIPQSGKSLKIVVTGGHPGDPEYGCGGTIARYTDLGHKVTMVYLNHGQKGCGSKAPTDCAAIRTAEARNAGSILKAETQFAQQMDGDAVVSTATYGDFHRLLETEKPDVLFAHWPIDGHRDHRAISMFSYDAWLRMGKSFAFYYYEVSTGEDTLMFAPTHYVDITQSEARKRTACYAHASQSPDHFYSLQSNISRFRGIESGFAHAEAFVRHVQNRADLLP